MADAAAPGIDVQLKSELRGSVAVVTVDNRRKLNTLNSALMRDFIAQVEALGARDDLRALVLTGAGDTGLHRRRQHRRDGDDGSGGRRGFHHPGA